MKLPWRPTQSRRFEASADLRLLAEVVGSATDVAVNPSTADDVAFRPADATELYLSEEEVRKNINLVCNDDHMMRVICTCAKTYARQISGGRVVYGDLVNEAITRVLAGTRRWPRDVPAVAFLIEVVRSIASAWSREAAAAYMVDLTEETRANVADQKADVEWEAICSLVKQDILGMFKDDPIASRVINGIMSGMNGKELQASCQLKEQEYATIRRKIRRRINRYTEEYEP